MDLEELIKIERAKKKIFKDESVLDINYVPEKPLFRENELKLIYLELSPLFDGIRATNLFIYGVTGSGKTMIMKYFLEKIVPQLGRSICYSYVNCREIKTEYKVLRTILSDLNVPFPKTGLSTSDAYEKLKEILKKPVLVVLDEIDVLVKNAGDDLLYNFSRNEKVTIVGISNDPTFIDLLDARTLSSLKRKEIVFKPYNATQLQEILRQRAVLAFNEGVLNDDVIPLCAAFAMNYYGDARKAVELLHLSGKIAVMEGSETVSADHVRKAIKELERSSILDLIRSLPNTQRCVLYVLLKLFERQRTVTLSEVVKAYELVKDKLGFPDVSYKTISRILNEFETYGITSGKVVGKGRGKGVSKTIVLKVSIDTLKRGCEEFSI